LQLRDGQYTFRTFITNDQSELRLAGDNVLVVVKEQLHYREQLTHTGIAGARAEPMTARRACAWVALACSLLEVSGCSTTEPAPPPSEYYVFDAAGAAGASAAGAAGEGHESAGVGGTTPTADAGGGLGDNGAGNVVGGGSGAGGQAGTAGVAAEVPRERDASAQASVKVRTYDDLPCVPQTEFPSENDGYCPYLECDAVVNCTLFGCKVDGGGCGLRYAPGGGNYAGE